MAHAYSPKNAPGGNSISAARLHVNSTDPFKEKVERDAARRANRANPFSRAKAAAEPAKPGTLRRVLSNGAALRLVTSSEAPRAQGAARPAALAVVASAATASAGEATVKDAVFTEVPSERISEKAFRPSRNGGGGAGGPPRDRVFNQDDLAGVLIVLAFLLLLALYLVRGGGAPAQAPQPLVSTQMAASEPAPAPAPLVDPFGDRPVDLTPKSPLPPPAVQVAPTPAPAPVCPSGRTMHAWFCTARSELTPAARAALEKDLAEWGACLSGKELVVRGFADTRGGPEYNITLSSARASVVAEVLRARGVKVAEARGLGELPDLADNENCANQRRVDVRLSDEASEPPSKSCAPPQEFAALSCG